MTETMDTATDTGRDEEARRRTDRFTPDDVWIDTFQSQLTKDTFDALHNYARVRALMVAGAGGVIDDYYARELVQDAIGDTWTGVVRWDPLRCSLKQHLAATLRGRSSKDQKHAEKHPHEAIGHDSAASYAAECDASGLAVGTNHATTRLYSSETLALLRSDASGDKDVLRLIDAYDAGAETKDDVRTHARMKARTYHNAHNRLRRIVRNLLDRNSAPPARD